MDAQGVGKTIGCFAATAEALVRRRGLAGDEQERQEKQSIEGKVDDGVSVLITWLRSSR